METRNPPRRAIIDAARNQWDRILGALVPELADAIAHAGRHVACPLGNHKSRDDFRLYRDFDETGGGICNCMDGLTVRRAANGFGLLSWIRGYSLDDAYREVASFLGEGVVRAEQRAFSRRNEARERRRREEETQQARAKADYIRRLWHQALPADNPGAKPLRQYVISRGLDPHRLPPTLRLHPGMRYRDGDRLLGPFPVMLAAIQGPDGKPIGLHRTYLAPDGRGKAPVPKAKKVLVPAPGMMSGVAIRLGPLEPILNLTEGIETALAVRQATGMTTWACVANRILEKVVVPEGVEHVVIWADKDRPKTLANGELYYPGEDSARILARRLRQEGYSVEIRLPPMPIPDTQKSLDWADMFVLEGVKAFQPMPWREKHPKTAVC